MKITRYPQSCFLIEEMASILIDPGSLKFEPIFLKEWEKASAIIITHKHFDHFNEKAVQGILVKKNIPVYATKETAEYYPNTKFTIIKEGQSITIEGTKVDFVKAIHGYHPGLKGGKEVNEGVGVLIHGSKIIYLTSDTICFNNDYKCDVLMMPYNNHGVCMSPFEASLFAKETGAKLVLPCHDDNEALPADKNKMEFELKRNGLNYKFLKTRESIEV
jgi:L-ascorbate metabolism protein UlaG (beta-lactamase superfamily)